MCDELALFVLIKRRENDGVGFHRDLEIIERYRMRRCLLWQERR
jgi:hypothetical protein